MNKIKYKIKKIRKEMNSICNNIEEYIYKTNEVNLTLIQENSDLNRKNNELRQTLLELYEKEISKM